MAMLDIVNRSDLPKQVVITYTGPGKIEVYQCNPAGPPEESQVSHGTHASPATVTVLAGEMWGVDVTDPYQVHMVLPLEVRQRAHTGENPWLPPPKAYVSENDFNERYVKFVGGATGAAKSSGVS